MFVSLCTNYGVTSCLPPLLLLCAVHTVTGHELTEPSSLMLLSVRASVLAMKRVVNTCVFTCKAHLKHLYRRTVNPQLPTDVAWGALMTDLLEIKVSFLVACFPTIRIVLSALVSISFWNFQTVSLFFSMFLACQSPHWGSFLPVTATQFCFLIGVKADMSSWYPRVGIEVPLRTLPSGSAPGSSLAFALWDPTVTFSCSYSTRNCTWQKKMNPAFRHPWVRARLSCLLLVTSESVLRAWQVFTGAKHLCSKY